MGRFRSITVDVDVDVDLDDFSTRDLIEELKDRARDGDKAAMAFVGDPNGPPMIESPFLLAPPSTAAQLSEHHASGDKIDPRFVVAAGGLDNVHRARGLMSALWTLRSVPWSEPYAAPATEAEDE